MGRVARCRIAKDSVNQANGVLDQLVFRGSKTENDRRVVLSLVPLESSFGSVEAEEFDERPSHLKPRGHLVITVSDCRVLPQSLNDCLWKFAEQIERDIAKPSVISKMPSLRRRMTKRACNALVGQGLTNTVEIDGVGEGRRQSKQFLNQVQPLEWRWFRPRLSRNDDKRAWSQGVASDRDHDALLKRKQRVVGSNVHGAPAGQLHPK